MKTNRPFEYSRYPEEREKLERTNAKLGCLFVTVILIAFWSVVAVIAYLW